MGIGGGSVLVPWPRPFWIAAGMEIEKEEEVEEERGSEEGGSGHGGHERGETALTCG